MGSPLGEVPWVVSRGPWKSKPCCLAVLSHCAQLTSLAQGALKAGRRPELHRESRSKSMVLTSVFPSFLFLRPWTLFTQLWFIRLVFQSNWTNTLWSHLLCPLQMNVSLCPLLQIRYDVWICRRLPNRTRGWDRWVFLRAILIVSNKEIKWTFRGEKFSTRYEEALF